MTGTEFIVKGKGCTDNLQWICQTRIPISQLPACSSYETESNRETKEDCHEGNVGPDAANEIDEAEEAETHIVKR